jgi:hypothetical protein
MYLSYKHINMNIRLDIHIHLYKHTHVNIDTHMNITNYIGWVAKSEIQYNNYNIL